MSLNEAMEAAKVRAEQAAQQTTQTEMPTQEQSNLPAVPPTGGVPAQAPSNSQALSGSFSVDQFFKVNEDGIKIGQSALIPQEAIRVRLDLSAVQNIRVIRYGNPAQYVKSIDGVVSTTGEPWAKVFQKAKATDGDRFRGDYASADIPMEALVDVKDMKGNLAAREGDLIGKSLSTTEWREWEKFLRTLMRSGVDIDNDTVIVDIGYKARTNNNGNTWGVLTYTFVARDEDYEEEVAA